VKKNGPEPPGLSGRFGAVRRSVGQLEEKTRVYRDHPVRRVKILGKTPISKVSSITRLTNRLIGIMLEGLLLVIASRGFGAFEKRAFFSVGGV
jgi:hypothetical protein